MLVVVVDDNPDDRELVKHQLGSVFPVVEVRKASDEASFATAFGHGEGVGLVVTDFSLKWTDGLEILARVKAARPECPVVMFTGTGDEETAVAGMKAGLDDYVVKSPRHFASFRSSGRTVVENARQRAALRETEASLREALRQKDLLLRELHHRVKNNVQTAVALLRLRARGADARVRENLLAVADRLQVLGQVQNRMLLDSDLASVGFAEALADLAQSVAQAYADSGVELRLDIQGPINLPVARAAPLGLLCFELILNAFKHAFPDGKRGGTLLVTAHDGQDCAITVADDGIGFDPGMVRPGTGGSLTQALAVEAGAEVEVTSGDGRGTRAVIRLKPLAAA